MLKIVVWLSAVLLNSTLFESLTAAPLRPEEYEKTVKTLINSLDFYFRLRQIEVYKQNINSGVESALDKATQGYLNYVNHTQLGTLDKTNVISSIDRYSSFFREKGLGDRMYPGIFNIADLRSRVDGKEPYVGSIVSQHGNYFKTGIKKPQVTFSDGAGTSNTESARPATLRRTDSSAGTSNTESARRASLGKTDSTNDLYRTRSRRT